MGARPRALQASLDRGRTAAKHWHLAEQILKDILVMTAQAVRQKRQERHGPVFSLKHVDERKLFGTKGVWRHQTRVPVSDVHRTIIGMLDDPAIGGGIQHLADCLAAGYAAETATTRSSSSTRCALSGMSVVGRRSTRIVIGASRRWNHFAD
jgi:predicted transcriptional regulator of viral defense system